MAQRKNQTKKKNRVQSQKTASPKTVKKPVIKIKRSSNNPPAKKPSSSFWTTLTGYFTVVRIHSEKLTKPLLTKIGSYPYRQKLKTVLSGRTYQSFFSSQKKRAEKSHKEFKKDKKKWFDIRLKRYRYIGAGIVVCAGMLYYFVLRDLPTPTKLYSYEETPIATRVYDRNDELLFEIFADENRSLVSIDQIPLHMQQATVAIEDKDFYNHHGINPVGGILRAVRDSILKGQVQGGSTITQQLIKNTLLTPERTIERKAKEAILAVWTDFIYSKDQILELYLNTVPYGGTAWGIDTASKKYFGKNVEDLTLAEAALLAGLPQAPSRYSPFGSDPDAAIARQRQVLNRMVEDGYITEEEAEEAKNQELVFAEQERDIKAAHFVLYVKDLLVEQYGQKEVEQGGLQVKTTLDYELQQQAQDIVSEEIAKLENANVTNGAALVTRPSTGEILAMVGSIDYFKEGWGSVNVTTRLRQPGSSIKPVNYAIAMDTGKITPSSLFADERKCYPSFSGPAYCPQNYDGTFHGPVQTRYALANSYNIPAVKTLELNTVEGMVASASAWGIDTFSSSQDYGLSLTLGGGEVRMTDMAEAFGVFANQGIRKDLVSILEVKDRNGKVLQEFKDPNYIENIREPLDYPSTLLLEGERAISAETAYLISHILLDNGARSAAFGSSSFLNVRGHQAVSVKTGTTDDLRDNWTIGYTPNFVTAVWVGNNDNSRMSRVASGVTGATPIWNKIMLVALENQEDLWPKEPDSVVGRSVCSVSGMLPQSEGSCPTRFEYFNEKFLPPVENIVRQPIIVWKDTDRPATPQEIEQNPDNVEARDHNTLVDVTGDIVCLDCAPAQPPAPPEGQ